MGLASGQTMKTGVQIKMEDNLGDLIRKKQGELLGELHLQYERMFELYPMHRQLSRTTRG